MGVDIKVMGGRDGENPKFVLNLLDLFFEFVLVALEEVVEEVMRVEF